VTSDYEVIVPDDCSSDNSVSFIKSQYPEVIVVESQKNGGFAVNVNKGLNKVSKDLIFIMNSDLIIEEDYFSYQVKYFEDESVFSVMGALHECETKKQIQNGLYPIQSFLGFIKTVCPPGYQYDRPIYISFSSGSNALVDRKKLRALNFFAEYFSPFYGEDDDLGLRAWRQGWKSIYDPKSISYHQGSATIKSHNTMKKIRLISRRNKMIYHDYHLDGVKKFLFRTKFLLDLLTRWIIFDFQFYKALKMFLEARPVFLKHRQDFPPKFKTSQVLKEIQKLAYAQVPS
jgi:GT2 family glycosyltransferase